MTVAKVASVAATARKGSFLRVTAKCRDTRATVAATLPNATKIDLNPAAEGKCGNGGFLRVSPPVPTYPVSPIRGAAGRKAPLPTGEGGLACLPGKGAGA